VSRELLTTSLATVLGFDIGLKRTGVASGQSVTKTASPCSTIEVKNGRHDWEQLDQLIEQWNPGAIIIGNPKSDDPHLTKAINRFKSHIQQKHKLAIVEVDETLTSAAANQAFEGRQLTLERKTQLRDQLAASLIVESYFASL